MTDTDPTLLAFARAVDRLTHQVQATDARVDSVAGDVAALADIVAALQSRAKADRPRSWLLCTNPDQAAADLADLATWLGDIYLRYYDAQLSDCWALHPAAVEELLWLRHSHRQAYDPKTGTWQAAADWHDRYRPGATKRVTGALKSCEIALHTPGQEKHQQTTHVPLTASTDPISYAWSTRTNYTPTQHDLNQRATT